MSRRLALTAGFLTFSIFSFQAVFAESTATFRSASGQTMVSASAAGTCAGDTVTYATQYQRDRYVGTLWVKSPQGQQCEGGRSRLLKGYFEERGIQNGEWCQGQLSLFLTRSPQGGSYIQWNNVQAVKGYGCAGAGQSTRLSLRYQE